MKKQKYVVGFLFNHDRSKIALIRKLKPEWQKGKLNGIGGKAEEGETAVAAMTREFEEETGAMVHGWRKYCVLDYMEAVIHFFEMVGNLGDLRSITDEPVIIVDVQDIQFSSVIPNLRWLVPMALDSEVFSAEVR